MATGTVKFFDDSKGFGFVVIDDDPRVDVFVNARTLRRCGVSELARGDRVAFDAVEDGRPGFKGKVRAENIRVVATALEGRVFGPRKS